MPNEKTDSRGFASTQADQERDMAAKGGPSTSLGNPDNRHGISSPYSEDLQTQIAAKSKHTRDDEENEHFEEEIDEDFNADTEDDQ